MFISWQHHQLQPTTVEALAEVLVCAFSVLIFKKRVSNTQTGTSGGFQSNYTVQKVEGRLLMACF